MNEREQRRTKRNRMTSIRFEVPGPPKAQKRHRTVTRGFGGRTLPLVKTYDPSDSDKADFLALSMAHRPKVPYDGPVLLAVVFWMPIPKGMAKYKRTMMVHLELGVAGGRMGALDVNYLIQGMMSRGNGDMVHLVHTRRPDADNMIKLVKDALNGVFWRDDSQVQISAVKLYSSRPRTQVEIIAIPRLVPPGNGEPNPTRRSGAR